MTRYLWTGESEFCICGHHVTDHETSQWLVSMVKPPTLVCRGGNRSHNVRNCECDEFRPYRIVGKEEGEEAIEKQNPEVIRK